MNVNKLLPLTETTYYILLSLVTPQHGYGIMQQVRLLSSGHVDIAPGTLYGALENLQKQKLIRLISQEPDQRRKIYGLTELGSETLTADCRRMRELIEVSEAVFRQGGLQF